MRKQKLCVFRGILDDVIEIWFQIHNAARRNGNVLIKHTIVIKSTWEADLRYKPCSNTAKRIINHNSYLRDLWKKLQNDLWKEIKL